MDLAAAGLKKIRDRDGGGALAGFAGALMESSLVDEEGVGKTDPLTEVESVCPYCGVGCQIIYQIKDNEIVAVQGRDGPANQNRLCVKGRFGFDYVKHPHRLTEPLIRREDAPKSAEVEVDPANPYTHFRRATWEEALDLAAAGLKKIRDRDGGGALAGFAGALMESSLVDEEGVGKTDPLTEVESVCPYCGVGCQIIYQIKDNEIVAVQGRDGPANQNRLCVKGRFGFDYVKHPHRLTEPLIRREDAPKSAEVEVDPADPYTHFRRATWGEALDLAAAGLKKIRDRDGGGALAGFGSAKGSNEEAYLVQKLVRTGFGTNNVDHCTRLCHASSVVALLEGIGSGAVTAPFTACEQADVIIVIGANPTENHPVAATSTDW